MMDTVPPRAAAATLGDRHWLVAATPLLSVRFIQVNLRLMEEFDA
jgi:hypothetical protein